MEGKLGTVGAKAIAYKLSERKLHRKHMLCLRISTALLPIIKITRSHHAVSKMTGFTENTKRLPIWNQQPLRVQ
ncbi:hypothetical protein D3C87_903580 [compost metagenome]